MAKELIVSVNGREKKIAIIENERVTEFYIERGEENQGIVGNIYKGRVMRVLPGMQSAFVDIGLERDAFLYVSDFFDEEEEFERIVLDKSKKSDATTAERAAHERIEQARVEREQHIEATQERLEPLHEAEPAILDEEVETVVEEPEALAEVEEPETALPLAEATASAQAEETEEGGGRRRGRRGRRRSKSGEEQRQDAPAQPSTSTVASAFDTEIPATPFAAGGNDFQRIVDEDEVAAENGAMFKDARLQERIFDQIHAVEFDIEGIHETEVGSLLNSGLTSDASFQRIDDSDIASTEGQEATTTPVQQAVAAHVADFIDEVGEDVLGTQSFERISDDEKFAEGVGVEETTPTPEPSRGRRGSTTARTTGARKGRGTKAAAAADQPAETTDEEAAKPKRARSTSKKAAATAGTATKSTTKKTAASKKAAATGGGRRKRRTDAEGGEGETDMAVLETEADRAASTDLVASEAADGAHFEAGAGRDEEAYEDGEASVTSGRSRAEFATRRGGRRRRRPGKAQEGGEDNRANGKDEETETGADAEEIPAVVAAPVAPAPAAAASPRPQSQGRRDQQRPERNGRDDRRPRERGGRESGGREGGGREGGGGSRRDRQQPTITDLLREGQEIIVQIAKEPIAKKGARITSHIALPGRFLVYMPTVEHVGVSRKIESDSERVRLRKLIQAIRAEEDVPSGGFIVRTAGIGISEADLRDDARYLVRTWLEIRKGAEKAKAPAMVHRDLDLVQRILRDQLSEEFTAIRVDSEDEYREIVEFINRIQPRMVKRVKLYTREEPILEAFGVQAEVEKAIKPRVWLRSGGYLVINQTEALVAIDVNTGKFVGRGGTRLEDTITRTNLEAVDEIVRQIRLRDLGGIIVLDLIDMEDRRNRNRVMQALQEALQGDKSPTKVLSFNDFGLVIMTRKRVKQSLERTLCSPCPYCQGAGLVKSPQTICYEILEEARRLARGMNGDGIKQATLRINPEVARALRGPERDILVEIEDYLGVLDITSDAQIHQEQFDFAFI